MTDDRVLPAPVRPAPPGARPTPSPGRWRAIAYLAAVLVALALAAVTFIYRFNTLGGTVVFDNDEFATLTRVDLLLAGEQPLRDFADGELRGVWPSLTYELPAWVLRRWDAGLVPYAYLTFGMLASCTAVVFLLGRGICGRWIVPILAALVVFLSQPNSYNYPKVLSLTVGAAAIWWAVRRPGVGSFLTLAGWTLVAGLFRHDNAIYLGLAAVAALVARDAPRWTVVARHVASYVALTALASLPSLIWIQRYGGIPEYFRVVMASSRTETDTRGLGDWPTIDLAAALSPGNLVAFTYYAYWLLPLMAAVVLVLGRRLVARMIPADRALGVALIVMALVVNQFFLRANLLARFGDAVVPVVLVACWLALVASGLRSRTGRGLAALVPALVLAAISSALALASEVPRQMQVAGLTESVAATTAGFDATRARLRALPPMEWRVEEAEGTLAVSRYLAECTGPVDRVLMGVYADEIPYFARRLFAGGQGYFFHGFLKTDADQRLALERLAAQSVPVAIVPYEHEREFAADYPLVAAHVAGRYKEAGIVTVDGVPRLRVLVERLRPAVRTDPVLGFPCFR